MNLLKNIFAILTLTALCAYATWQKLQVVSIVSIVLLIGVLYKNYSRKAIEIIFSLTRNTKQAKFGQLEINIEKKLAEYSKLTVSQSAWMNVILSKLSPEHLGLLLTISREQDYHTSSATIKDKLRDLRALGLLNHNEDSLANSTKIWLTELGNEVASTLTTETVELRNQKEKERKTMAKKS